jgi:hypothetical protein
MINAAGLTDKSATVCTLRNDRVGGYSVRNTASGLIAVARWAGNQYARRAPAT